MKFAVIIPTYNPGNAWLETVDAINAQVVKPDVVLIIDSSSRDDSVTISIDAGFQVKVIKQSLFNHGGTRNMAIDMCPDCEFVVFMTQDAVLVDSGSINNLLAPFSDDNVAAVCGRQLPKKSASLIEAHARLYNYSEGSNVRSILDRDMFGLKTAFLSNSFAAYRVSTLKEVGCFPEGVIFGEDMYVAAKLLEANHKIAYAADTCVYHSHHYSIWQEMKRYFDMGVFHSNESWIREGFGCVEGQGVKFVISELKYLLKNAFWLVPGGLLRTMMRYVGFRFGLICDVMPLYLNRILSMNKGYFK